MRCGWVTLRRGPAEPGFAEMHALPLPQVAKALDGVRELTERDLQRPEPPQPAPASERFAAAIKASQEKATAAVGAPGGAGVKTEGGAEAAGGLKEPGAGRAREAVLPPLVSDTTVLVGGGV